LEKDIEAHYLATVKDAEDILHPEALSDSEDEER
jgi:hypothetical protein